MSEFSKETLAKSEKVIGQIYPVIVNQDGKVLEGDHRLAANPDWEKKVVETKSKIEDILVRMHAHHRRRVPQEETKALLIELAGELEKGGITKENVASELVKIAPYSKTWILMLLPVEFKKPEKVEAGKVSGQLIDQKTVEKQSELQPREFLLQPLICKSCGLSTRLYPENFTEIDGETYCKSCAKDVKPPSKSQSKAVESPKVKVPELWPERKAHMTVPVSSMEVWLAEELTKLGVRFETQKVVCVQSSTLDFFFPDKVVPLYIDHVEIHKGTRRDKDEVLREKVGKRFGKQCVEIEYSGNSEKERQRVLSDVLKVVQDE